MKNSANMLAFPYGMSNFQSIAKEGYFFIDKTPFIEQLEAWKEKHISFVRPRRIGKSLLVSMLEYYYGIEHKSKFEELFGKLYIGQNPTPLANSFAVLKMDFSGIDTRNEDSTYKGFLETIRTHILGFNIRYKIFNKEQEKAIQSQESPESLMKTFFEFYQGEKIYLIIDEYDHFTNEILIQDLKTFKKAVTQNGYVRKFYETIKIATQQGIVDRVFITGVSPVTLDSLTSGFNIISHFTTELAFHDMVGFTEEQVSETLDLILENKSRKEAILNDMRMWYNGYQFHKQSPHKIYNSDMVLYFFKHFQRYQTYPDEMLDPNIAPDYGKLKKMFEIQNPTGNYDLLETILYQNKIISNLVIQFSFDRGFLDNQFISFLYYMGYLTIAGEAQGRIEFHIPNLVIKELYWDYFAWLVTQRENIPYDEYSFQNAVGEMTIGNINPFMEKLKEVLKTLSNRDYQNFDEKYIKIIMIAFASQAKIYYLASERETPEGYIDLLFLAPSTKKIDYEYIFELKYIKKSEASEKKIEQTQNQAKEQLLDYIESDPTLKKKKNLRAYTFVFVKDEPLMEAVGLQL